MAQLLKHVRPSAPAPTRARGAATRSPRGTGEDGVAMVIAVILTAIVFSLGAVWMSVAEHAANSARYARHSEQAANAADAGLAVAAAALSSNSGYTGVGLTAFPGGAGFFEVSVAAEGADFRRVITATGHAPAPDAPGRASRTMRQVVDLEPAAFQYAMLSDTGISTGSASGIVGDIYANGDVSLGNAQDYVGDIYVQGNLSTGSNQNITGNIRADGNVSVTNSSTTVAGNVHAGGNISTGGWIEGNAVAGGTIRQGSTDCAKVTLSCSPGTPPPPVPVQTLPTFTWNPLNYVPAPVQHASGAALVSALAKTNASGVHYAPGNVSFNGNDTLYLVGNLTIVVAGSIDLPRQVENRTAGGTPVQLSVISTCSCSISPANNFTIPSTVRTLLYTTGAFQSSNSSTFAGALYAGSLSNGAHVTVTHAPLADDVGFNWSLANPQSFGVRNVSTYEVNS